MIGSSFISMELVVAISSRKLASIDVIGMEEVPFETVLGKEVGAGIQKVTTLLILLAPCPFLLFLEYNSSTNQRV